jgi:glycosyltransferase involved in cell wall biosynthesis
MKILFITDNFPPEVNAPATRTYEHCKEWIKNGADVTIITCAPNFPHGHVYEGYKNQFYQKEMIDGIQVIRVWSYISTNSGFIKRILDYTSFAFMAFGVGLFQKHDVIIGTSPQFFTTWAAWGIAKIRRKPWVFELRDIWPESIKTVGAMQESRVLDMLEKIELALYRSSDKVIAVTDAFKANLISRGIDESKIEVVTNGSNMELFSPREKDKVLLKKLHLEEKFIVGYLGTHGMAHSLDFVVRSIGKITDEDIHFLFVGDGAMKQTIIDLVKSLSLSNITFLDPISKDEMPRYLSIIDVSLAPLKRSDNFKTVIPSKIFEASAMGKPTLLGVEGQAQEIIEKYHAGICFIPEDENDFVEKVLVLKNDIEFYTSCMQGCGELAKAYDRKKLADKMLNILKKI